MEVQEEPATEVQKAAAPKDLEPVVDPEEPEEEDGMDLREKALFLVGQIQGFGLVLVAHRYDSNDSRIGATLCNLVDELKTVILALPLEAEVEHTITLGVPDESP